jgi:hypothetical protein
VQTRIEVIKSAKVVGKWMEFWFENSDKVEGFDCCSKTGRFFDALETANLGEHVLLHGITGLKLHLKHDGSNWEIEKVEL